MVNYSRNALPHIQEKQRNSGAMGAIVDGVAVSTQDVLYISWQLSLVWKHATEADYGLMLAWKIRYPDWWINNMESKDKTIRFEHTNVDIVSVQGTRWMKNNVVNEAYGLDVKKTQLKAKSLGLRVPSVVDFQNLIENMPGETEEEKHINAQELLNLSWIYLVSEMIEGVLKIYSFDVGHLGEWCADEFSPRGIRLICS